ncbi:general secretion pathway protein GspK [Thiofilum flexile]|uniref:general secretion pathway protein GspK n=1 Tax=Thiofilum flexile TaxID=125627 RepID=UPI0003825274|nr:type II secretion system protein GspK [Thiofilum flexile]
MLLLAVKTKTTKSTPQQGVAMMIVLWMIVILMMMAGSLIFSSRTQMQMMDYARFSVKGRALAEAATHFAVMQLFVPTDERKIKIGGGVATWEYDGAKIDIRMVGENGLVDLNQADRPLLFEVLKAVGVAEKDIDPLIDKIDDFRDPDDLKRVNGAEDSDYEREGIEAGAKDAPIERIEELQQVLDITPELYKRLARYLTVSSNAHGINPMMAPRHILLLLAKGDQQAVDTYIQAREEAKGGWVQPNFGSEFLDQLAAPVYRMQISVSIPDEPRPAYIEERSVRILPGRNPPFITYYVKTVSPDAQFE